MLIALKYGGNAMAAADADPTLDEVAALAARGDRIVLVHGGGPQIDAELDAKAIDEVRVQGLRVTGRATRDVVEYVLCGTVNKALVRALAARGARAVGISGEDGDLLRARRAGAVNGVDLGYVGGEIVRVDPGGAARAARRGIRRRRRAARARRRRRRRAELQRRHRGRRARRRARAPTRTS